ncbi:aromatic-ring-hydroxylating dioxygenase subunit beta [Sphingobium scionense]|jgi:3-phenylpropionate/cinnamic acid dioxygenase small subunit|uniref:Ring hydroxylating dioxygenase beta subunit n=5 Tax=Sphingomonadaceae TaxID=41297 RepID=A2TC63_SPHYA|nr:MULTISPECIES: aromatic-ring-hydroxylating dioxygenase subunit beta [Sphingomonadaceae]BAC65454.1 small subunit of oxygenase [Sphingomonas sp. P2]ABM79815.1 ring hydroxylating dioxygenase beta subunit [Sphingobium yanoikuyae]KFD28068.1 aromatic-ring-hydroxylating dioxygenase [Sphingobium yanoikuyae]MBB4149578.1 3-phenylpropionate/cinnamic acid dioxygenase small subunit [Sphingobium scionense]MDV3480897.1 aromatic-ring-hydroxylating dioxygenase subunit beta [Sphingobium yanoikuyae]
MMQTDTTLESALDALLMADASALDSKDMMGWLANYSEEDEASYICRAAENSENGLALGFMYDDCRSRLEDRVTFVNDIWVGTFQDYRTRHFVQRVAYQRADASTISMRSNFSLFMTPTDSGITQVLAAGQYLDTIRLEKAGALKLLSRRAELDTSVLPRYLVYPI